MSQKYELPPPSEEIQRALTSIAETPSLAPAHPRYVRFYSRPKQNQLKSSGGVIEVEPHTAQQYLDEFEAYGARHVANQVIVTGAKRAIFDAAEYVEILSAGDPGSIVDRPVRELDKYLWSDKYVAFRNGLAHDHNGTLLSAWGGVTPERVEELKSIKIHTVEALAEVPDSSLAALGMHARSERKKAQEWLAVMKGAAPVAELKAENDALRARLEALEKLAAGFAAQPAAESPAAEVIEARKPGRPKKQIAE
jgi:hypothetical protein